MDWTVLGIEPTSDTSKIEQAYNEKLQNIDLENRPEEFVKLREAYEEALRLAGESAGSAAEFKPGFLALYSDFSRRIDPKEWKEFLDVQDKALGKNRSQRALLDELMDRHILPNEIWKLLEDRYHFSEQKQILYGSYPAQYVNEVILRGPSQSDLLPFELFVPGKDGEEAEKYMRLYYEAMTARPDQAKEYTDKMNELREQHPYGKALEARNAVFTGDTSKLDVLKVICQRNPGHPELKLQLATAYMAAGEPSRCAIECEELLKEDKDNASVSILYSQALASLGRYREASDTLSAVIRDPNTDTRLVGRLSAMRAEWNVPVIREHEQAEEAGRETQAERLDHAWRCLQNNMIEEAAEIAAKIEPGDTDPLSYNDLKNQIGFVTGDYEDALKTSGALIFIADNGKEDDS